MIHHPGLAVVNGSSRWASDDSEPRRVRLLVAVTGRGRARHSEAARGRDKKKHNGRGWEAGQANLSSRIGSVFRATAPAGLGEGRGR